VNIKKACQRQTVAAQLAKTSYSVRPLLDFTHLSIQLMPGANPRGEDLKSVMRRGCKALPGANTVSYFGGDEERSFIRLTPGRT